MCGEHAREGYPLTAITGSSPHVRGTRLLPSLHGQDRGIIPACAGNTHGNVGRARRARDHPRMCGEHALRAVGRSKRPGSSPHVRGTPVDCVPTLERYGIIPACAGNTRLSSCPRWAVRDHPRMCGEHSQQTLCSALHWGSSPHVRGTHDVRFTMLTA